VAAPLTTAPAIERVGMSTLSTDAAVLDDTEVLELHEQLRAVTDSWLEGDNAKLRPVQRSSTLTLDYEYHLMDTGWPARSSGIVEASRMVVERVRTIEAIVRSLSPEVRSLPVHRDFLALSISVFRIDCSVDGRDSFIAHSITTDPPAQTDLGCSEQPFVVWITDALDDPVGCNETELLASPTRYLLDLLAGR
jgi:hypothetical protein